MEFDRIKTLLVKFFSIALVAGLAASCSSVADSGFDKNEFEEETTVDTDIPEVHPAPTGDDEMDPIITEGPRGGR